MTEPSVLARQAAAWQEQLVAWRRALHQMPETGLRLPQTMAFLRDRLEELAIPCTCHEDISCLTAVIGRGEPCILLRADADALPMAEETELPFRARNGCMHSCGHDLHAAMLLGAAALLRQREGELHGTVKLLFQSGEECFAGARAAIDRGVLEGPRVSAALALHVVALLPPGELHTGKEAMAAVDVFRLTLRGRGGHGSMPECCVDPIPAAVQVYLALQSLLAREVGATEEAVLTVGQLSAGDSPNSIPEEVTMQGTLRTFRPELRRRLLGRMRELLPALASAFRCSGRFRLLRSCGSVITDETLTALAIAAARRCAPELRVQEDAHGMGSEDFAAIAERVPAAYLLLGAGPEEESRRRSQHDPRVEFNEAVLHTGAAIYAQTALDWLARQAEMRPAAGNSR